MNGETDARGCDWDYQSEPVIGRVIRAKTEPETELSSAVGELADDLGIERKNKSPRVTIEVGDIDWDETKSVTVRLNRLKNIVSELEGETDE